MTAAIVGYAHGIRLRRLRLHGTDRTYDVDFRSRDRAARPLSVIAGAFSTGKTTVLEFIDYCLGASDHPRHPEVMPKVHAATLEVDLSGVTHHIERSVGEPSTYALVHYGSLDEHGSRPAQRRLLRPAGSPDSLSSLLLSHCKLEGVRLRELPAEADSQTDPLSFRDLMALCFLPNERLDGRFLLYEHHQTRNLKLRQVFDVVFDVHDDRAVELGRRIKDLDDRLTTDRAALSAMRLLVDEHLATDRVGLERAYADAEIVIGEVSGALRELDERGRADTAFATRARERHAAAAAEAHRAFDALRDAEAQQHAMHSLRSQYADDVSRLGLAVEARLLLDQLPVTTCPVCRTPLAAPPTIHDGQCTLCGSEVTGDPGGSDLRGELRAAKARLAEVSRYLDDLDRRLPSLRATVERTGGAESEAVAEVDAAASPAVTPYLTQRDALTRRRQTAALARQAAATGLRLVNVVERRAQTIDRHEATLRTLREELAEAATVQPDRSAVIDRVGERYRRILAEWRYPKLSDAYLADDLTPYVRGSSYAAASSGSRTLIALAWQLAIFEVAWETGSSHPGFLLLDSPRFAGAAAVADLYRHLQDWLSGRGRGAQVIVADNAPPAEAAANVIVRFSRRPDQPPYGLIDDETA